MDYLSKKLHSCSKYCLITLLLSGCSSEGINALNTSSLLSNSTDTTQTPPVTSAALPDNQPTTENPATLENSLASEEDSTATIASVEESEATDQTAPSEVAIDTTASDTDNSTEETSDSDPNGDPENDSSTDSGNNMDSIEPPPPPPPPIPPTARIRIELEPELFTDNGLSHSAYLLTAAESTDKDGQIVDFHWEQVNDGAPAITIKNPFNEKTFFKTPFSDADGRTEYLIKLTVTDDEGETDTAEIEFSALNRFICADCTDADMIDLDYSGEFFYQRPTDITPLNDGKLYVSHATPRIVELLDAVSGTTLETYLFEEAPRKLSYSSLSENLFVGLSKNSVQNIAGEDQSTVVTIDVVTGNQIETMVTGEIKEVIADNRGGAFVVANNAGEYTLYRLTDTGKITNQWPFKDGFVSYNAQTDELIVARTSSFHHYHFSEDDELILKNRTLDRYRQISPHVNNGKAVIADSHAVSVIDQDNPDNPTLRISTQRIAWAVTGNADTSLLFAADERFVSVYDGSSGDTLLKARYPRCFESYVGNIEISPDGKYIYALSDCEKYSFENLNYILVFFKIPESLIQ